MNACPKRPAWAEVDLDALAHNIGVLRRAVAPSGLWAVVKADGYGHGAVRSARAALAAGADGLCVALVQEGVELRAAGVGGRILVLSEPSPEHLLVAVRQRLTPTVYTERGITATAEAAESSGVIQPVHLKIDTGMHRVGTHPADAVRLAAQVVRERALVLEGVWTHLAAADELESASTTEQLARFDRSLADLAATGIEPPLVHAANSAGGLAHPHARRSFVRAGIAVYGIAPSAEVAEKIPSASDLRPALSLKAEVSYVKTVEAGEAISYGLRYRFPRDAVVATVPLGYADGVPRRLFGTGGEVLIGGRRRPIVGVVTMDQLMVDCGDDPVSIGDEVVLIGRQGDDEVTASEWGDRLGTISYEIVCGLSKRIERIDVGGSASAPAPGGPNDRR
jgi:alanine racemase